MELFHGTSLKVAMKLLRGEQLRPWTPADYRIETAHEYGRTKDRTSIYAVVVVDQERGGFSPSITGYWDSDHHLPVPLEAVIRIEFYVKGGSHWEPAPRLEKVVVPSYAA